MFALLLAAGCTDDGMSASMNGGPRHLYQEAQDILSFENHEQWSAPTANSEDHTHGAKSAIVNVNGWTEVVSVPLSTIGASGAEAKIDIRVPFVQQYWGDVRLIVKMPSQNEWYRELGSQSIIGMTPDAFHTLTFNIPSDLQAKFGNAYSDLTFTVVINAAAGAYLLDNLDLQLAAEPDSDSGTDGPVDEGLISIHLPGGVFPNNVVFGGGTFLKINDRVSLLRTDEGHAAIACTGEPGVNIGVEATVGHVVSQGQVVLRDRCTVDGAVITAATIAPQSASYTITGETKQGETLSPFNDIRLKLGQPAQGEDQMIPPDTAETLSPGEYGRVVVSSRSSLSISHGVYRMDALIMEPQSRLIVNDVDDGTIAIVIDDDFIFRGTIESPDHAYPALAVIFRGTNAVALENAFSGLVLAPDAKINMSSNTTPGYAGSFFADEIEVHQDSHVTHVPFSGWKYLCQWFGTEDMDPGVCGAFTTEPAAGSSSPMDIRIPAGVAWDEVSIGAATTLTIGQGVQILDGEGAPTLMTSAGSGITAGSGAIVPGIASTGAVSVGSGAQVNGDVKSGADVLMDGSCTGTVTGNATMTPVQELSFVVSFPGGTPAPMTIAAGDSQIIAPEDYSSLTVQSGGRVYFLPGEYSFSSLVFEDGAEWVLDALPGQKIAVDVYDTLALRGVVSILGVDADASPAPLEAELALRYGGLKNVAVAGRFMGSLVAPSAIIQVEPAVAGVHRAMLYGKAIELADNTILQTLTTDLHRNVNFIDPDAIPIHTQDHPVDMIVFDDYSGTGTNTQTVTLDGPVAFEIPENLIVRTGNAGNHPAELVFVDGDGETITCQYQGGADSSHPTTLEEMAAGLEYEFVGCDNDLVEGDEAEGSSFTLTVVGDALVETQMPTSVALSLGEGSSGYMPAIITPREALEMLVDFSWDTAPLLAEVNDEGHPALHYVNIFIDSREDLDLLDALFIHHDNMPFFGDEMERIRGKSGEVDFGETGFGVWEYAIMPGKTYNLLRALALDTSIEPENRIPFPAIRVRPYQPTVTMTPALYLSDGSLSYTALANMGFRYMGKRGIPDEVALSKVSIFDSNMEGLELIPIRTEANVAAKSIFEIIEQMQDSIVNVPPAGAENYVAVDVNLVDVDMTFPDYDQSSGLPPSVDQILPITWGEHLGEEMAPHGISVKMMPGPLGMDFPVDQFGRSLLPALGDAMGGTALEDAEWVNLCYYFSSNAMRISSGINTTKVCEDLSGSMSGSNGRYSIRFDTGNANMLIAAELKNAKNFSTQILGYHPPRANILRGKLGTMLGGGEGGQIYTPVFNTLDTYDLIVNYNALGVPVGMTALGAFDITGLVGPILLTVAPFVGIFIKTTAEIIQETDIVVPKGALNSENGKNTFGVMTHEYGHFVTFNLLHKYGPEAAMDTILLEYLMERKNNPDEIEVRDESNIVSDTLADYFAAQVVGGTNYFDYNNGKTKVKNGNMYFCFASDLANSENSPTCIGVNDRLNSDPIVGGGNNAAGILQIRLSRLLHDAIDGRTCPDHYSRQCDRMTDDDHWKPQHPISTASLIANDFPWGSDHQDEPVILDGIGLDRIMYFLARRLRDQEQDYQLGPLTMVKGWTISKFESAIADAIRMDGFTTDEDGGMLERYFAMESSYGSGSYTGRYTWCDACEVFALHETGATFNEQFDRERWQTCLASLHILSKIGVPDDIFLRYDDTCRPCREGAISIPAFGGVICDACDEGFIQIGNNCVPCPWNAVVRDNTCVSCRVGEFARRSTNSCESCPFGKGPNPASPDVNSLLGCEPCPPDAVVDLSELLPLGCSEPLVLNQSDSTAGNDICSHEFWIQMTGLDALRYDGAVMTKQVLRTMSEFETEPVQPRCTDGVIFAGFHDEMRPYSTPSVPEDHEIRETYGSAEWHSSGCDSKTDLYLTFEDIIGLDSVALRLEGFLAGIYEQKDVKTEIHTVGSCSPVPIE